MASSRVVVVQLCSSDAGFPVTTHQGHKSSPFNGIRFVATSNMKQNRTEKDGILHLFAGPCMTRRHSFASALPSVMGTSLLSNGMSLQSNEQRYFAGMVLGRQVVHSAASLECLGQVTYFQNKIGTALIGMPKQNAWEIRVSMG